MRLHLISLPWTQTTAAYTSCAYTQKCRRFGKMMLPLGHEVILYSGEENDAICTEHVPLITEEERVGWFGEFDPTTLPGDVWEPTAPWWLTMNGRAISEIAKRAEPGDILCLSSGWCQKLVADALPHLTACEPFVGYKGIATRYRAFESHAWRSHVYGRERIDLGVWYDATIPNFFDLDEFPHCRENAGDGDYLLFLGRVTQQKGPHVAAQIAERVGMPLKIAGPGAHQNRADRGAGILHGDWIEIEGTHVDYIGPVGIEGRADLLSGARAVLMPTLFIEPFGGVAVEAMLSGCPVVTPDWGAFTETNIEGVTGYRFTTIPEAIEAVTLCDSLDPQEIRESAISRYSLEAVGSQFDRWFRNLAGLRGGEAGDWYGAGAQRGLTVKVPSGVRGKSFGGGMFADANAPIVIVYGTGVITDYATEGGTSLITDLGSVPSGVVTDFASAASGSTTSDQPATAGAVTDYSPSSGSITDRSSR